MKETKDFLEHSISENTVISLSVVVSLLGGIAYVTWVAFQGNANASAIEDLKRRQATIEIMATDIAVIKNKVESIEKSIEQ